MEITLTNKVDELRKIYQGEVRMMEGSRTLYFSALILATNSAEALAKLTEFRFQEHPSVDESKCGYQIGFQNVIA